MTAPTTITFVDAVRLGFVKFRDFSGRASKREFWYWVLFLFLVRLVTTTVDGFLYPEDVRFDATAISLEQMTAELATAIQHSLFSATFAIEIVFLVPTVAVAVRRFRDAGWAPWLAWLSYTGIYFSLVVGLIMSSLLLSSLTLAGAETGDQSLLIGGFIVLVFAMLLEFSSFLILLIGGLQPSRHSDTE